MKEDQRTTLTRQLLKNALMDLLKENRLNKITVKEICKKAELNRATFYRYYGSPFDLIDEIQEDMIALITQIDHLSHCDHTQTFRMLLITIAQNREWFKILLSHPDINFIAKVIEKTASKSIVYITGNPEDMQQVSYASYYLNYGFYFSIRLWLEKEEPESIEQMISIFKTINNRIFHDEI